MLLTSSRRETSFLNVTNSNMHSELILHHWRSSIKEGRPYFFAPTHHCSKFPCIHFLTERMSDQSVRLTEAVPRMNRCKKMVRLRASILRYRALSKWRVPCSWFLCRLYFWEQSYLAPHHSHDGLRSLHWLVRRALCGRIRWAGILNGVASEEQFFSLSSLHMKLCCFVENRGKQILVH